MTGREDFTDEEWFRVRSAPWQVAMGVVEIARSGPFTTGRELRAVEDELGRVQEHGAEHDLIRVVAHALASDEAEAASGGTPPDDESATDEDLPTAVLTAMAALAELLTGKVTPEEAAAYRAWLVELATKVAEAGKEGGFAGIGGRRVSQAEQAFLTDLEAALGA